MNRRVFFFVFLFLGVIYAPFSYADGVLGVTGIFAEKTYAQAGGGYEAGWKWTLSVTVPDNEPVIQLKFGNWTNASSSFSPAHNVRFYSAQSSNANSVANAITMNAVDTYGSVMNLLPVANAAFDLSTSTSGRQIEVVVETKIPEGAGGGTYTGGLGIQTLPDTTPPVTTLLGSASVTIERGASYTEQGATATDNIDGAIASSSVAVSGSVTTSSIGTYTLSYTVSDAAGNTATSVTRTVLVQDTIAPTGTASYSTTEPTNQDIIATLTPSEPVIFLNTSGIATTTSGTATTTFTQNSSFSFLFADVASNTGSTTASVANIDKVAPTITSFSLNGTMEDVAAQVSAHPVSIVLNSSEAVNWLSLKIQKQSDSSVYKLFQSGALCEDGGTACTKTWNGDVSAGTFSGGVYRIRVHIRDMVGNETDGYLSKTITVLVPVVSISVTGPGGATDDLTLSSGGDMQMSAIVLPSDATNQVITWDVYNQPGDNGQATMNASTGVLHGGNSQGRVRARATAVDGSGIVGEVAVRVVQ